LQDAPFFFIETNVEHRRQFGFFGLGRHHSASKFVSPKHLGRYVDEFAFRLNEGNIKNHTLTRLDSFVDGVAGKRLTYKGLIQ
jgi:hypothetical protein